MSGTATTWPRAQEIPPVVLAPRNLRRTVCIALAVGSAFFAMNQLGVVLSGHATALVWLKVVVTYLTPLVVSNVGVLAATRPLDAGTSASPDNDRGVRP